MAEPDKAALKACADMLLIRSEGAPSTDRDRAELERLLSLDYPQSPAGGAILGPMKNSATGMLEQHGQRHFLYLRTVQRTRAPHALLPVLTFQWDWQGSATTVFSIRVALFPVKPPVRKVPQGFGWRFEQSGAGDASHSLAHAQPVNSIREDVYFLRDAPRPDETTPAIPLRHGGPMGIVWCCMWSLYGDELLQEPSFRIVAERLGSPS